MKQLFFNCFLFLIFCWSAKTQAQITFTAKGDAFTTLDTTISAIPATFPTCLANSTFQLTDDVAWETSAVWANTTLDLTQDFVMEANVYFGNTNGADGIAFVLQTGGTNVIGRTGGNIGYGNQPLGNDLTGAVTISPSVAIELDVFNNGTSWDDLPADHVDIIYNGRTNSDGTTASLANFNSVGLPYDLEDGAWHTFRIEYIVCRNDQCFNIYVDDTLRGTHCDAIVDSVFGGTTNVTWGITAATGSSDNDQAFCLTEFAQTVPNFPTLTATDVTVCIGDQGTLTSTVVGGTAPYDYEWTNALNTVVGTQQNLTTGGAGTYDIMVKDDRGCTDKATATLTVNVPTVTIAGDLFLCLGESTTLTANLQNANNPIVNWKASVNNGPWFSVGTGGTLTVSPNQDTRYQVEVIDENGCRTTDEVLVNVRSVSLTVNSDVLICEGETTTLTASAAYAQGSPSASFNYSWTPGGQTSGTISVTPAAPTTYTVVATSTDAVYGCSATAQTTVEFHDNPTPTITANPTGIVCLGNDVTLTASNTTGSINAIAWTGTGITTPITTNPTILTPSLGTTTYTVLVADANGCQATTSIDVEVEECCPIREDSSYFHLTANTDPALLAQYNIIPAPLNTSVQGKTRYVLIGANGHHSLPNRLYIDDGIILEVRGPGAVLDLVNSDVVFGACARLEVLNGGELKAYNTVFRPCNESTSWGGVVFTNTAAAVTDLPTGNIRECTFINADVGLYLGHFAEGGYGRTFINQTISNITIQDNLFSNCRRGIRVNNLAPNQAISGNDFQIDNVDNITFHGHERDCAPIANNNDYIGIELLSAVNAQNLRSDYELNIHQNTFIDATPIATSQSEYTGIQSLTSLAKLEISANDFTNMFQSMRLSVHFRGADRYMMIENNEINVTRRARLNNVGSSQIVINETANNASRNVEIFNNRLSCSAEALALNVLPSQTAAFMQSAIHIDNISSSIIRDNIIEGFEVGIYVHQAGNSGQRRAKIADNQIKSNYYGIFLDSELATEVKNSINTFIQCNEIEMDLENTTTSVGIAVHFNRKISPSTNYYLTSNCIKHTYRAIEVVNNSSESARMPTILNNYLYNYNEAGISIDGKFNRHGGGVPSIGRGNDANWTLLNGHNTFISNNENNAFDIFATAASTAIKAINNDYGSNGTAIIDNGLNNVDITQVNDIQYPSFAKCANQDASLGQSKLDDLGAGGRALYFCGEDNLFREDDVLFRTNTSGTSTLQGNYAQTIQDLVADNDGGSLYGLTVDALGNLSNQSDKDVLYATVVNTGLLTANQIAWLSYEYESAQGNYATAKQMVEAVQGETEDEEDWKAISMINMDLFISSRSIQELTNNEIQTLKVIDDRRAIYANDARTMIDAAIGGHDYIFAPYPLSKPLASKSVSRLDLTAANLTIYPNPTNDAINIDFVATEGSDQVLTIYTATGKLVKSVSTKAMIGQLTIDVADLAQGMYIATLKSEDGNVQSGKFVKQ